MKVVVTLAGLSSHAGMNSFLGHKALIEIAGKYVIDYVIEGILDLNPNEIIFVLGNRRKRIEKYLSERYSELPIRFVHQEIIDGSGSAVRVALDGVEIEDELMVLFGDKILDCDFRNILKEKREDALVFSSEVMNPSKYDIISVRERGDIYEVENKPENPACNNAMIGAFYFKSLQQVKKILLELKELDERIDGSFKFAQVVHKYIEISNVSIKACFIKRWFNCVRPEIILEANRYFLEKFCSKKVITKGSSIIISPSFVAKDALIENSIVGPYASVGSKAKIINSNLNNCIVSSGSNMRNLIMKDSIVGKKAELNGKASSMNIGDNSKLILD